MYVHSELATIITAKKFLNDLGIYSNENAHISQLSVGSVINVFSSNSTINVDVNQ
jgi:hypothetical protein